MTLKEIARQANVSVSTVSRVLNNPNSSAASAALRTQIMDIAKRSNYTPNTYAKSLRIGKRSACTQQPVYVLIACPLGEVRGDPFFITIAQAIQQTIAENNLSLGDTYSIADLNSEAFFERLNPPQASALIIVGRFSPEVYALLKKKFDSIVYVGINRLNVDCDQVICDGYEAIQESVKYLYVLGHRRIGFIGAEKEGRYRGFIRSIQKLGLTDCMDAIVQTDILSMDGGYSGMKQLIEKYEGLTAVACANDMTAIGALQACKDMGLNVPKDISLVGLQDIPNTRFSEPKLTTIHAPLEDMGEMAARTLIDKLQGKHSLPLRIMLPFHIVERDSCCSPIVE